MKWFSNSPLVVTLKTKETKLIEKKLEKVRKEKKDAEIAAETNRKLKEELDKEMADKLSYSVIITYFGQNSNNRLTVLDGNINLITLKRAEEIRDEIIKAISEQNKFYVSNYNDNISVHYSLSNIQQIWLTKTTFKS